VQEPNVVNFIDTAEMARDLRVAHERGADFVITLIHWGIEYAVKANAEQEQTARWLLTHGCDAVVGGHPHVVQNFTLDAIPGNNRYPETVIYSMGNAVSNMSAENTRLELAVRARFVHYPDGSKKMLEPELSFLWCCLPGTLRDNYVTIPVADFLGRRDEWIDPSDYDNMTTTYKRVTKETGIIYEENHQAGSN
jgi:poly-gamma-glutamate synthesis protein (capsule biosynthesis protein)